MKFTFYILLKFGQICYISSFIGPFGSRQSSNSPTRRPIIFDSSVCPSGWEPVGDGHCVQLSIGPNSLKRSDEAELECERAGAQLVNVLVNQEPDKALISDISSLINEVIQAGVKELTWLIGGIPSIMAEKNQLPFDIWVKTTPSTTKKLKRSSMSGLSNAYADEEYKNEKAFYDTNYDEDGTGGSKAQRDNNRFALRKRTDEEDSFDIVTVSDRSVLPFICSILPWKRKALIYQQALSPKGSPKIVDTFSTSLVDLSATSKPYYYHYYTPKRSSKNHENSNYISLACRASGTPAPVIKWFHNGGAGEQININQPNSPFLISGGSLMINLSYSNFNEMSSFYCTATNKYGTVRSSPATVRPVFIEAFRDTRLDVYPLSSNTRNALVGHTNIDNTGGTRIDCQAPRHYPKSHSFSWMSGGSTEHFVQVSERIFISMDGTLYFSYNLPEDEDRYACTLALSATQSGQHGPFFRLILPQYAGLKQHSFSDMGSHQHPHYQPNRVAMSKPPQFPPRIDEYQPNVFPEFPLRGQTVYIECFAYAYPAPMYKWSRVDGLKFSKRHRVINYGRVLRIDSVRLEDAVRYKCTAKNNIGTASAEIQLIVQAPTTVLRPMIDQLAAVNETVVFHCLVNDAINGLRRSNGNTNTVTSSSVEWFHDGHPLVPLLMSRENRQRIRISNTELRIRGTQPSDSGIYQCIVSNNNDIGSSTSTSALLTVRNIAPKFHANVFPAKVFVIEGSKLSLPCLYHASPAGVAEWRRLDNLTDTKNLTDHSLTLKSYGNGDRSWPRLELADTKFIYSGKYECSAKNSAGHSKAVTEIVVLPKSESTANVENRPGSNQQTISCEVEIDCKSNTLEDKLKNCPEALFEWKFNDRPVRSLSYQKGQIQVKQKDFVRQSSSTLPLDLISNLPNSDKELFNPKITVQKSSAMTYTTHTQLPNKRLYKTELNMPRSFADNNVGRWSCNSAFGIGAVLEQEPAKLMFTPPTMLSAELREVVNGQEGWRRFEAAAKLTWKQPKMPALSGNSVQKRRETEELFKIDGYVIEYRTAEDRNWKAVTGNLVSHVEGNVFGSYQVQQLEPNQKYQFRIRTKSANKEGYLSVPSAASTWLETPESPPRETIKELRSRILDDYHLFLEWDPIEIDHSTGPNLRYNVSWSSSQSNINFSSQHRDNFDSFETVEDPSLVLNIATVSSANGNSLENGACQTLAVSVRPFNDLGSGPLAADTVIQLTRDGPRRQAQNMVLTAINSTHLKISWSWLNEGDCENVIGAQISCDEITPKVTNKPQLNSRRRDLTGVESSKEVDELLDELENDLSHIKWSAVNQSVPAHYTQWLIHDLKPLTDYRCRIRAFDQHGRWGPASVEPAPQAKTLEPAPTEAPQIIYIRLIRDSASNSLATLIDWKAVVLGPIDSPIDLGGSVDSNRSSLMDRGYKVFIYPETGQNPTILNIYEYELTPGQNPSARIDGLKTMFFYTIQIAGFNSGGLGPLSQTVPIRIGAAVDADSPVKAMRASANSFRFDHIFIFINTSTSLLLFLLIRLTFNFCN